MHIMSSSPWAAIIVVGVILLLVLAMRWAFKPPRRPLELPIDASESPDLGLLTVVASGVSRQEALRRRATLGEAGIRSSMSRRRDGRHDILVFDADADTARFLLDR